MIVSIERRGEGATTEGVSRVSVSVGCNVDIEVGGPAAQGLHHRE